MPSAPAIMTSKTLSGLIPPRPKTGILICLFASRNASTPTGAPYCAFDGVANTGPKVMKSAPPDSAARASSIVCVETPTSIFIPTIFRTASGGTHENGFKKAIGDGLKRIVKP